MVVLFNDGTDLKAAQQDVSSAMTRLRPLLPPQAANATVQTISTNSLPILNYAVSAEEPLGEVETPARVVEADQVAHLYAGMDLRKSY